MAATTGTTNIYIVGAQCAGKTTIVSQLRQRFQALAPQLSIDEPEIISEVARNVLKKHAIETENIRADPDLSLNLQNLILAAKADAEDQALARGSWFISDRSGLDPIVYAREYAGAEAAAHMVQSDDWLMVKKRMSRSIVVVCEAGMGWLKDDGVRLMPRDREDWIAFHELFCGMLDKAGLSYHILPATMTDLSERVNFVLSKWQFTQEGISIRPKLV